MATAPSHATPHYLYARTRHLQHTVDELWAEQRRHAVETALEIGLLNPHGPGSWTHPHHSRAIYADGKVLTPLTKLRADDSNSSRVERDAGLHCKAPAKPPGAPNM